MHLNRVRVSGMEAAHQRGCRTLHEALAAKARTQTLTEWLLQVSLATGPLPSSARALVLGESECALVNTVRERKTWKCKRLWTESKWRVKMLKVRQLWVMTEEGSRKPGGL